MNFPIVFYLFTIANILIISFIRIGKVVGGDSDSEISELESIERFIKKGKWSVNESADELKYCSGEYLRLEIRENIKNRRKLAIREEYDDSPTPPVLQITDEEKRIMSITYGFKNQSEEELQTVFNILYKNTTHQQKLSLCRRVWSVHVLKSLASLREITKDEIEKAENCYNMKKIDDNSDYLVKLYVSPNETIQNVRVLGCRVELKSAPFFINVYISPHSKSTDLFYLILENNNKNLHYIIDLIDNIEIPQENDLSQSRFLNTVTKSFKTYLGGK